MKISKENWRRLLWIVVGLLLVGCQRPQISPSDAALLSNIQDPETSYAEVVASIQKLGPPNESPEFWSAIANDESRYSNETRCLAVLEMFERHCKPGTTLATIAGWLGPSPWLKEKDLRYHYTGASPVLPEANEGIVIIEIIPNDKGEGAGVFLRTTGDYDLTDLYLLLKAGVKKHSLGRERVTAIGSFEFLSKKD